MVAGMTDEKEGLSSILHSGCDIMNGVNGSFDALASIISIVQLQNQTLRLHAAQLMESSAKLHHTSSEVASMLTDAVSALDESRVAFDSAVYKFTSSKESSDHSSVLAHRVAYEAEVKNSIDTSVVLCNILINICR
jgi:hypothetical protein